MNKTDLKKNRLDLEYKFESQKAIIFLTLGTITLIGFLTAVIIQKYYVTATVLGFVIFISAIILYKRTKRILDGLLQQIEDLAR